jgi:hypothetical protein
MKQEGTCSFCGAKVIRDDEAQTVGHADPVCGQFDAAARAHLPEVRQVKDEAVDAHLSALSSRVRNQKATAAET